MKKIRKIIKIEEELCNGCGQCVPDCAEGSLQIIDGKAKLVADKLCDGLGACLGSCPTGALVIEEREADAFDEEAVEEFLSEKTTKREGCPSLQQQNFQSQQKSIENRDSLLSHWPVQLRLIQPNAPFLQGADLLIAADCTTIAARNFQEKYLEGKVVAMGCPKFDDRALYKEKLTQIFKTSTVKSLTLLIMEVPCCSAMRQLVIEALNQAKVKIPYSQMVLTLQGDEQKKSLNNIVPSPF